MTEKNNRYCWKIEVSTYSIYIAQLKNSLLVTDQNNRSKTRVKHHINSGKYIADS
jgi:hypothetical protein